MDRRRFVNLSIMAGLGVTWPCTELLISGTERALASPIPMKALHTRSEADVLSELFGTNDASPSELVTLSVPMMSDPNRGTSIEVRSQLSDVRSIAIVTKNNRKPLNMVVNISGTDAFVSSRIVVEQSSPVTAYVLAAERLYFSSSEVKVSSGGYGMHVNLTKSDGGKDDFPHVTKIRSKRRDDGTLVQALVRHPMTSGAQGDTNANAGTAHFIEQMFFAVNDKTVAVAFLSPTIAANPLVGILLASGKRGDKVSVHWTDNRSEQGRASTVIQ